MKRFFRLAAFLILPLVSVSNSYADSKAALDLKFSSFSYADSSTSEGLNFQAETHLLHKWNSGKLSTGISAGLFLASYPDFNFQIPEAFVSYKLTENSNFSFGRKMPAEGLYVDSEWGLSVLQSSFRMEPLRPEMQGLTGLHYHYKASKFFMYGLFSPFFIPDQTQSLDQNGDSISSDNPWASLPPQFVDLNGSRSVLNYEVENDSLPDLLSKLQFGGSMGFDFDNIRVSAFYYHKPSRQLSYKVEAQGTNEGSEVVVNAQVTPQFLREHLYGLQAKLDWYPNFTTTHGAYGTLINDDDLDQNEDYQTSVNDYFIFSNSLSFRWKKGSLRASHIHFNSREIKNEEQVVIDFNRFIHGSSIKLGGTYKVKAKSKIKADILYDYENQGIALNSGLEYKYDRKLSFWSELQILHDLDSKESSNSIFERFEGLDSIRLGAKFVF